MILQDVTRFLRACLECSVYLAPREPGLTQEEIHEACKRAEFLQGEISDALSQIAVQSFGRQGARQLPDQSVTALWLVFQMQQDPEYRNIQAFDFVYAQCNEAIRNQGGANAQIEREVVVQRAMAQNISRRDAEAAITILVLTNSLVEKNGYLRSVSGRQYLPLPSQQRSQMVIAGQGRRDEVRERAYLIVQDIVERRTDGRPKHAEPHDAFAEALEPLGYGPFRLWWVQTVAELRQSNVQTAPVSALVLAAALVEGALTFVVKHARSLQLAVFRSKDFDGEPRTWKIDDLVASAASGSEASIS